MQSDKNDSKHIPLGTVPEIVSDYGRYCRPEMARMLQSLSLDAVYERAEGDYMWQRRGEHLVKVLDLIGGFGVNLLGHYHPELVAEELRLTQERVPLMAQGSCRRGATFLAKALCERAGDYVVIFANTGTETVEAAIKHLALERPEKRLLGAVRGAFHGTTWQAFWAVTAEGRPAAEVAAALGMTAGAVCAARHHVLRRLRQELAGLLD